MTRDIKRIKRILKKIEILWKRYPDQRFFQLLFNYSPLGYFVQNKKDPFFYEDDKLEASLDSILDNIEAGK